jgi:hypothetical protein
MARACGYYTVESKGVSKDCCFVCATKAAVTLPEVEVHLETTDYEYCRCADCGKFIEDRVEI